MGSPRMSVAELIAPRERIAVRGGNQCKKSIDLRREPHDLKFRARPLLPPPATKQHQCLRLALGGGCEVRKAQMKRTSERSEFGNVRFSSKEQAVDAFDGKSGQTCKFLRFLPAPAKDVGNAGHR